MEKQARNNEKRTYFKNSKEMFKSCHQNIKTHLELEKK